MGRYTAPHRTSRKPRNFSHSTKILVITVFLLFISLFIVAKTPVHADASNNPIFATIQDMQNAISTALSPIQNAIANLQTQQANQAQQISSLQNSTSKNLKVYDANGNELGIIVNHTHPELNYTSTVFDTIFNPTLQRFIFTNPNNPYFNGFASRFTGSILYQSSDCTGAAYTTSLPAYLTADVLPFNPTTNYIFHDQETPSSVNLNSSGYWDSTTHQVVCNPYIASNATVYELYPVNLPFPTPIAFPLQFKYQ